MIEATEGGEMLTKICRFASLFLTALSLGGAFGHLLEMPNKLALGRREYLLVQQRLYEGFGGVLGVIELGALLTTLLVALLARRRRAGFVPALAGAVLIAAALVVWQVWVGPVNGRVEAWTPSSMPADWPRLRASWEYGHAARAVLFALALASLLGAALSEAPTGPSAEPTRAA